MAKSGMRLVRRPNLRPQQNLRTIRQELIKELEPVARQHVSQRSSIVSSWSNRPDFSSVIAVTPKQIRLEVFIKNASQSLGKYGGTVADLWRWHNVGTGLHGPHKQAYSIVPRFKSILRFVVQNVFDIRLGPGGRFRNRRTGQIRSGGTDVVYTPKVKNHPGMRGKKHNEKINKRLRPNFIKAVNRGMKKGFIRALKT